MSRIMKDDLAYASPREKALIAPPEKIISISRVTLGDDGHPAIALERYAQADLVALIEPRLTYLLKHHGDAISGEALAGHVASVLLNHNPHGEST